MTRIADTLELTRSYFGGLPEQWTMVPLKFIMPRLESGVSVNAADWPVDDEGIGVLKTSCVYGDVFRASENKEVVAEEHTRVACPVTAPSIIISRMNTPELVGSCGFVDKDHPNLFLPDRLWIARFTWVAKVNPRFIWYVLVSKPIKSMMAQLATGTSGSMKNLSQRDFMGMVIPNPSITEQDAIAAFLDRETARMDALTGANLRSPDLTEADPSPLPRLIRVLAEYRSALIQAAITGQIDVRNYRPKEFAAGCP